MKVETEEVTKFTSFFYFFVNIVKNETWNYKVQIIREY